MEHNNDHLIQKLNHLINTAEDGSEGYKNAAKDIEEEAIKNSFLLFSKDRSVYASQLRKIVFQINGAPEDKTGGALGTLHRTWMDLQSFVSGKETDAVINACITGEEAAIKEYKIVLDDAKIPENYKVIISEQLHGIEQTLANISAHV